MRGIVATAQIFAEAGKPQANLTVVVEAFMLKENRWDPVGKGRTGAQGTVAIKVDAREIETTTAPALRLIEEGDPQPRVLAQGGMVRFDSRRNTMTIDFGQIDRLEETAFKMPNSSNATGFSRITQTVAGVSLQQGRSEVALNRNLREIAGARDSLASVTRAREDIIIADVARDRAIATGTAATALGSLKEIDTLKSITHEQNQRIIAKDQELVTTRAEFLQQSGQLKAIQTALAAAQKAAEESKAKAEALEKAAGVKADVANVVTGIGTKLSLANQTLQMQAHPFRIGTVRLDLSGRPSADGSTIELGGSAEQSGSKVSTELHVGQTTSSGDEVTVPDVVGLTESAARRVIRSVGLRLSPVRQTLKASAGTPGQSISQHPIAGASAKHGSEVLVVFGTAPNQNEVTP